MEPFIGQIQAFGFNFAPRGWAFCNGQLLPINQNTALFALLGTTYGGDGRTTFGLPELRGRAALHSGTGPGLSSRSLGQKGGAETTTLTVNEMPSHNHGSDDPSLRATANPANTNDPAGNALAMAPAYNDSNPPATDMDADSVDHPMGGTGGDQAHDNMQPYMVLNYCIALTGSFPSRN